MDKTNSYEVLLNGKSQFVIANTYRIDGNGVLTFTKSRIETTPENVFPKIDFIINEIVQVFRNWDSFKILEDRK